MTTPLVARETAPQLLAVARALRDGHPALTWSPRTWPEADGPTRVRGGLVTWTLRVLRPIWTRELLLSGEAWLMMREAQWALVRDDQLLGDSLLMPARPESALRPSAATTARVLETVAAGGGVDWDAARDAEARED